MSAQYRKVGILLFWWCGVVALDIHRNYRYSMKYRIPKALRIIKSYLTTTLRSLISLSWRSRSL